MITSCEAEKNEFIINNFELLSCGAPNALLTSEKFNQFLRIFASHRSREAMRNDDTMGIHESVTARDIIEKPGLANEAQEFFRKLEMRGSVEAIGTLAQIVRETHERILKRQEEHAAAEKKLFDANKHLSQKF